MVAPLALSPSVLPGPRTVNLLNDVRAPFHVHPPHSVAMLVVRSHPNPNRAFCGGQRSVGEPAPRTRTTGPGYRACKPRDLESFYVFGVNELSGGEMPPPWSLLFSSAGVVVRIAWIPSVSVVASVAAVAVSFPLHSVFTTAILLSTSIAIFQLWYWLCICCCG